MVYRILVILLLTGLIGVVLFRNKQEIDSKIALAELKVVEWPVVIMEVRSTMSEETLKVSSKLEPSDELKIFAKSQGEVVELNKKIGDAVRTGDVIAKVDDFLLKAEIQVSNATLAQARLDLKRMTNLNEGNAITAQQLEQTQLRLKSEEAKYQSLNQRLRDSKLIGGMAGIITSLNIKKGELTGVGHPIGTISNLSVLTAKFSLRPSQTLKMTTDRVVHLVIDEHPGVTMVGKINTISRKPNDALKYIVEVNINNSKEYPLLAGMFVTAIFDTDSDEAIRIDKNSILGDLDHTYVYVIKSNKAEKRSVQLGKISFNGVEIVNGLEEGEQFVISGHRNLKDGAKVKVITN